MKHGARFPLKVENGLILVGSDAHLWPGEFTTAQRGFIRIARRLGHKLKAVVMNGDLIDGAAISRHPKIGWEYQPTVADELIAGKKFLTPLAKAAHKNAELVWTLGNHDARFETRLAEVASEYANVPGIHLKDHFPDWRPAWSVEVNANTIIKHRWKGGMHAAVNNAKDSGRHTVTGHLHALNVSAYTDYNGTRFGVDGGTLANPDGPQFTYTEDNPLNWRSGFVVLRYVDRRLMWPDVAVVVDERKGKMTFRGEDFTV